MCTRFRGYLAGESIFHKTPRDGIKADFLKFQIHKKKGFVATLSKSVLICLVLLFFFQKSKIAELIFGY